VIKHIAYHSSVMSGIVPFWKGVPNG